MIPARLLLVEDDPDLRSMLTELLTDNGYSVEAASDGQRGLHLGLTRRFDVLMLDRRLPVVDGMDLLTGLRSRGVTTPVLMLSALAQPGDRVAGLDAGAEDYLGKPFDIDELLARLRALNTLAAHPQQREPRQQLGPPRGPEPHRAAGRKGGRDGRAAAVCASLLLDDRRGPLGDQVNGDLRGGPATHTRTESTGPGIRGQPPRVHLAQRQRGMSWSGMWCTRCPANW